MADLAAFLAARLDDDEAAAIGARDQMDEDKTRWWFDDAAPETPVEFHVARHDPARVLRQVAAGRAILELHKVYSEPTRWGSSHSDPAMRGQPTGGITYWCEVCDYDRDYGHIGGPEEGCETLRHLAAVYRDHPDYDRAWAPSPRGTFLRKETSQ